MSFHYLTSESGGLLVHPQTGGWLFLPDPIPACTLNETSCQDEIFPRNHHNLGSRIKQHGYVFDVEDMTGACLQDSPETLDTVIVKLTNRCNEACKHCYDATGEPLADITTPDAASSIKQAIDISKSGFLHVIFHGGEPFLRFRQLQSIVSEVVDHAERQNKELVFSVQTNASIFTDEIVQFLKDFKFRVGISVDGPPEVHDHLRVFKNGRSTFAPFDKNLNKYNDFILEQAGILTTVSNINVKILKEVLDFVHNLGFKSWNTTIFDETGRGKELANLSPAPEDYFHALKQICRGIKSGLYDNIRIGPIIKHLDNILLNTRPNMCLPGNKACGAASRLLNIEADGVVNGCDVIHQKELNLGHLDSNSIEECYSSTTADLIRNRHLGLNTCSSCTWLGNCGGTCLGRSGMTHNNDFDCKFSQLIFPFLMEEIATNDYLVKYYEKHCI